MADDNPHAASYIHTVQHLIEECILFNMTKHECMDALSRHANIQPLITSTVWDELEKVNRDFFQGYTKSIQPRARGGADQNQSSSASGSDSSSQLNGAV